MRTWADSLTGKRGPEPASPSDMGLFAHCREQVQHLDEERVEILCGETKEWVGLAVGASSGRDLDLPIGDGVPGREMLEDAVGLGRTRHRDGAGQSIRFVRAAAATKMIAGARSEKFCSMMFTDVEDVETSAVGDLSRHRDTAVVFGSDNVTAKLSVPSSLTKGLCA